jgi:plastocyanin
LGTATFALSMRSGNLFEPRTLTVPLGGTVKVTNQDLGVTHNWTDPGIFTSSNLSYRGTYAYGFTYTGSYLFECTLHSGMTGSLTVT